MAPNSSAQQGDLSERSPQSLSIDASYSSATFELPGGLIASASQGYEPPKKRQKTSRGEAADKTKGVESQQKNGSRDDSLDYIVVNQCTWEVECDSSKLSGMETPLELSNLKAHVSWDILQRPQYVSFIYDKEGNSFTYDLSEEYEHRQDVLLALEIHRESIKWSKGQSKIWTEFGLVLLEQDGVDYIHMVFTIKWNVTHSIQNMVNTRQKPPALERVIDTYFPDPNVQLETWTPQDFYQSVCTPDKNDAIAATIDIDIKSTLYPFQKRAVRWLLRREGMDWDGKKVQPRDAADIRDEFLPPSFIEAEDACGQPCFVSSLYGCVTLDLQSFQSAAVDLKGGILAEEMGLGKTVEMISLITAHRRPQQDATILDAYSFTSVQPIGTTLIICPPTLVQQWISEIHKHSHLTVMHYEGINRGHNESTAAELRDKFINTDVVISTYGVLSAEIYYTPLNPEKSLRRESKYKRPKSPLMEFSWWRICMDEAQMVESGVSKAATVARMLPRINAWCITGTPVRSDVNDLLGLLIFLRAEPYASTKHLWASLISTHKREFRRLFHHFALRHSKKAVRNELKLPAQKRYVITMPFTPIEEQHYQELFYEMCRACKLNSRDGTPSIDDWDLDRHAERMRSW
jgi:E3 ubiquitin-protein ligase SHPRH